MGPMMSKHALPLAGAFELCSEAQEDARGWFARYFCQRELEELHAGRPIRQINSSFTAKQGAIRGLHFQYAPHAEDKFVRCLRGRVFDVLVDLRRGRETYGQWHGLELDAERMNMVFIPRGFAHGFQTLESDCQLLYLHTEFYAPEHQGGVQHASPELGIEWPLAVTEVSDRDAGLAVFDASFAGLNV